jgi:L-lactate dehydrogenase complex protein LldG
MSFTASSRQRILQRIHIATARFPSLSQIDGAPVHENLPRNYVHHGTMNREACLELMIERLREYDAVVAESSPDQLPAVIAAQLASGGKFIFVAPEGLPTESLAPGYDWKVDNGLPIKEIEHADGVVTAAFCGVADSGTIVLHHSPTEGRRVLTLLPDWHLCILHASQVVETLPEYFGRCQRAPVLATFISGPSATADIEMTRIKGVHGPRLLAVILVRDEGSHDVG